MLSLRKQIALQVVHLHRGFSSSQIQFENVQRELNRSFLEWCRARQILAPKVEVRHTKLGGQVWQFMLFSR
jgi:hypothetical protein